MDSTLASWSGMSARPWGSSAAPLPDASISRRTSASPSPPGRSPAGGGSLPSNANDLSGRRPVEKNDTALQGRGHPLQLLLRANLWAAAGQGGGVAAGAPQNQSVAKRSRPPDAPPNTPWVAKRYLDADMRWDALKVMPFLADYPQKQQQKKPAERAAGVRKEPPPPKTTPERGEAHRKANYTEEDIQAAARSNNATLHQPCTVQNGRLASGFLALTLPPYPERIGLVLDDNPIFGFPEIKSLSASSPIASQIPLDFRSECFITSIESTRLGRVVPQTGRHCGEVLNLARGKGVRNAKAARVTVAFAKNPLALCICASGQNSGPARARQLNAVDPYPPEQWARATSYYPPWRYVGPTPWYYVDPWGNVLGPFTGDDMRMWLWDGYFDGYLHISQSCTGPFRSIRSYFPDAATAFIPIEPRLALPRKRARVIAADEYGADATSDGIAAKEEVSEPSAAHWGEVARLLDAKYREEEAKAASEELWEIRTVFTASQIIDTDAIMCDSCSLLVACCIWKSNLGRRRHLCYDCGEEDHGGWPEDINELSNKKVPDGLCEAIQENCTRQTEPLRLYKLPLSASSKKRCKFEGCKKFAVSGWAGFCIGHGKSNGVQRPEKPSTPCNIEGCPNVCGQRGASFCTGHTNLVALAGNVDKMMVLVDSVSQMLAKMSFEEGMSSSRIQCIARIYSEGCKNESTGKEMAKEMRRQVTRGGASPVVSSQRFCGFAQTRALGKKRTLVLIVIRVSPKTKNNGHTQIIRIIVAIYLLQARSSSEIYEVHPVIFAGMGVDRRESFKSDGVHTLFDTLIRTPEHESVLVVANEALRVSSESQQVKTFEDTTKALHPHAKCMFLKQSFLDHEAGPAALDALIETHAAINAVSTHDNPGKSVEIDKDFLDERRSVERRASRIYENIASFGVLLNPAAARGIERPSEDAIAQAWRDTCNRISDMAVELQDEAIQREAANFVLLGNTGSGGKHAIYHRTSPSSSSASMDENALPIDQVSRNLAMVEKIHGVDFDKEMEKFREQLIVFHDEGCARDAMCNHQFAKLLAAIIRGELDSVFFTEPNRPTSRLLHFKLLHAVCELKGTKIWYSKCIGQDELAVAQAEEERRAKWAAALEEYNTLIEDLREAIADKHLRTLSYAFKKLSGMLLFPGIDVPESWGKGIA